MIALLQMTESLTSYKRLQIMEAQVKFMKLFVGLENQIRRNKNCI